MRTRPNRWQGVLRAMREGATLKFFPVEHGASMERFTAWRLITNGRTEPVGQTTIKMLTDRGFIRRVDNHAVLTTKGAAA